jgi:hypothetical protein
MDFYYFVFNWNIFSSYFLCKYNYCETTEKDDIFDDFYAQIYDIIHKPNLYVDVTLQDNYLS